MDNNPVMFIDDRWCYDVEGKVSKELKPIEIGKAKVARTGKDVTIVAASYMFHESIKAAKDLEKLGIDVEVINLRTIKPWDFKCLAKSLKKTGRAIIADTGWIEGGIAAEISSRLSGELHSYLKHPIIRIGLPNTPAPCARTLEEVYYPRAKTVVSAVNVVLGKDKLNKEVNCSISCPGIISY